MTSRALFQAAIFDFDGVIADSIPLHFEAFRRLFREEGLELTMDDYRRRINGLPRDRSIRAVLGDLPAERMQQLMDRKGRYVFELLDRRGLQPIPGSLEFVRALRSRGLRTAIASSSRTARRFLEAIRPLDPPAALFDAILEGDGIRAPKPDPEIFHLAARALGVVPERCLAFEDAATGVAAARSAGMRVVALTTTDTSEALRDADRVYANFAEIDPDDILRIGASDKP